MPETNHVLGKGELHFVPFVTGTNTKTGEQYFGNTPSFGITVEAQKVDHFNSDRGLNEKDLTVTISVNRSGSFVTDNIIADTLAKMFLGSAAVLSQASETATMESITVLQDRTYQVGASDALPSGKRSVTITSVTSVGGATVHVLDTDYTVDAELGRVFIIEGGGIADGTEVEITYDVAAHSRKQTISGTESIYGALRFIAYNNAGEQTDYYMPKVSLMPNGEFSLKGDDFQQISFTVDILKDGNKPAVLADGRAFIA